MHPAKTVQDARQEFIDKIIETGKSAFDPAHAADASQRLAQHQFQELINATRTWNLLPALNTLVKPNAVPAWLRSELMKILTLIPLRPDGVRGTLEFVFAVHPSSAAREPSEEAVPQRQGARITPEALAMATKLLSSPPSNTAADVWFNGIAPQLFVLLDGQDGPELTKVAASVIGYGILGKKQFGAPGSPGWNAFVVPILRNIKPSLRGRENTSLDSITDLSIGVLASADDIALSLKRLWSLLSASTSPNLCNRILDPILLELWALASWSEVRPQTAERYTQPAKSLLQIFLKVAYSPSKVTLIICNLLYRGNSNGGLRWEFHSVGDGAIESRQLALLNPGGHLDSGELNHKADIFVQLMVSACPEYEMSSIFLTLFRNWLQSTRSPEGGSILLNAEELSTEASLQSLHEVIVLQKMMEKVPEKLISHFDQLLELISEVLEPGNQAYKSDDIVSVTLSLSNLVLTAPSFQKSHVKPEVLKTVETGLENIGRQERPEVSQTAKNLALVLQYRDQVGEPTGPTPAPTERQVEDRKTYNLAMSYIMQADSPPPVRSEGLNLISGLISNNSPILDVPAVLVLLSSLLKEDEDFINLRAIKMFSLLANKHPKTVTQELIDHYLDPNEASNTDTRLRFGEALLQVIERLGQTFTGEVSKRISEVLLSIASRRGYRPKTEARQAREERLRSMKNKEAEDAWAGDVPDMGDDMTEEQEARNDIIAQIVQGWESKRGSEDVRMRTSALSVFATAVETNISGVGSTLVSSAVDLCVNVLVLEPEMEKGILRRAAIIVILKFVAALEGARLGFGLADQSREDIARTLKYVAATDNDGLVRQHAQDVVDSLESWQVLSLLPESRLEGQGLQRLAGLQVNAERFEPSTETGRPRIEEIE